MDAGGNGVTAVTPHFFRDDRRERYRLKGQKSLMRLAWTFSRGGTSGTTRHSNVDAGCAAVPLVPLHFFLDESQRGGIFSNVIECCINKVGDQLWQLQILAILAMTWLFRFCSGTENGNRNSATPSQRRAYIDLFRVPVHFSILKVNNE